MNGNYACLCALLWVCNIEWMGNVFFVLYGHVITEWMGNAFLCFIMGM